MATKLSTFSDRVPQTMSSAWSGTRVLKPLWKMRMPVGIFPVKGKCLITKSAPTPRHISYERTIPSRKAVLSCFETPRSCVHARGKPPGLGTMTSSMSLPDGQKFVSQCDALLSWLGAGKDLWCPPQPATGTCANMFGVLSFWTSKLKNWAITPTKSAFRACPDLLRCMRGQFCPHHTF